MRQAGDICIVINSRNIKHPPCMLYYKRFIIQSTHSSLYDLVGYQKNKLVKILQQDEQVVSSLPEQLLFYFLIKFYLFVFRCIGSSLLRAGFLQLWQAGATLRCSAQASHCGGFSCCRAQALGARASVVVARGLSSCGSRALDCRLGSCGTWAQLLYSMWDLPRPGLEPVSPALAGGVLTSAPPGKSPEQLLSITSSKNLSLTSPGGVKCFLPQGSHRIVFIPSLKHIFFFWPHVWHAESQFPEKELNPCPQQWKRGVLTTGPPGKSLKAHFQGRMDKTFFSDQM